MEEKKNKLVNQLLSHFEGNKDRVRAVGNGCKTLGFSLSEEANIDAIAKNPEAFFTLVTMADMGVLSKIQDALDILKQGR